ncbi:hypothetical protein [Intestinibacter sp.]
MKKMFLSCLLIVTFVISLSGCVVTDNNTDYERKEFKTEKDVTKIAVIDKSTDVTFQVTDSDEITVEYSDSETEPIYDISIKNGTLNIEKTASTVGVEDNSLIISLPKK